MKIKRGKERIFVGKKTGDVEINWLASAVNLEIVPSVKIECWSNRANPLPVTQQG